MAKRKAYVHVGLPGTGTEFLDQALRAHADALAERGLAIPSESADQMFRAALEIRRDHKAWGLKRKDVEGTWSEICRRARKSKSDVVVSQDLLAAAPAPQAHLLIDGLGGFEVHLVLTVRDPARQVASEWQELVKTGRSVTLERFRERLLDPERGHEHARMFWAGQHLREVLDRWAAPVKPHRVHVIVLPPEGNPTEHLWHAFGRVIGLDTETLSLAERTIAPGLGSTELAVLRGVNRALDDRVGARMRRTVLRRYFADRVLASDDSPDTVLPAQMYDELRELAESWAKTIADRGYDVLGDLDGLLVHPPEHRDDSTPSGEEVPVEEQLRATTDALADVLVEVARLREQTEVLEERNHKLDKKRRKLKRRLAEQSQQIPADSA